MLPSCKQVAELLSENIDEPISGFKKFKLKLHLFICRTCRLYDKQITLSSETVSLLDEKVSPDESVKQKALDNYRRHQTDKKAS